MDLESTTAILGKNFLRRRQHYKGQALFSLGVITLAFLIASISFVISTGLTPVISDRSITLILTLINAVLVTCLVVGHAASRMHVIIITLQTIGQDLRDVFLLHRDGSMIISSCHSRERNLPIQPQSWIGESTPINSVKFQPKVHNFFGIILKVDDIEDAWFYAVRETDLRVLDALRLTELNANHYCKLEVSRVLAQIAFAVFYFCLFLVMLLSAVWGAISIADRLLQPNRLLNWYCR
ncbi:MAG: Nitrogen regulation protein [Candidatus Tokpelaia sp. JSC188]|nr:MAG: Nitrogen regulation protein [Candidatus Tokpelaia sp. JSC188]